MDTKTKFQQLWAQFGTAFMEEPMRDHEKRVEELVRENERLRLEIATSKAETSKVLEGQQHKFDELSEENESLRQEVNNEVRSGIERVQERNQALALIKKENASLKQTIANQETVTAQERAKYKQAIKLLKDELEGVVSMHEQLRQNIGVLRGDIDSSVLEEETDSDADLDQEKDQNLVDEVELQLQAERSLQSTAYRRATRRQQVDETPGLEALLDTEEADDNQEEELEYYEEIENGDESEADEPSDEPSDSEIHNENEAPPKEQEQGPGRSQRRLSLRTSRNGVGLAHSPGKPSAERSARSSRTEASLRRSTRIRNSDVNYAEPADLNETIEVVGTKRSRGESSDVTTTDGASQIPDRQTEYHPAAATASTEPEDPNDRPNKRTRRQTERYINALETTRNMAKIMTPPATSPTFLPAVLPRRSTNRSPARRSTSLSQVVSTPKPRRSTIGKSPATAPPANRTNSPVTKPSIAKSPKSPRSAKKKNFPTHKFDFVLVSGYKHGRNLIVEDAATREMMEGLLDSTTERIREFAITPGFWRSYAHKRNIQRADAGLTPHCAFTSQFPLDSDAVELDNPWSNGEDYACQNCTKEGIACFTVGDRIDTEKYGAVYRPPKGRA
ncbi:hypothetical protein DRE_02934 [Drechslerella stenobrocha 248]|uniref:Uncharacterized protein n=1 Tax=Drechslerella stenobrocha 248 TaxID=1043628 RepID=W7HW24_9PEZI|nr:hypothetical protein DRE_02934 [Drechslerella stenobrocha 248]